MEKNQKSEIWKYFTIENPNSTVAKCKECRELVSRGGENPKKFSTTNLRSHLRNTCSLIFCYCSLNRSVILV